MSERVRVRDQADEEDEVVVVVEFLNVDGQVRKSSAHALAFFGWTTGYTEGGMMTQPHKVTGATTSPERRTEID